jgi:hypothetical protein
MKRTTQVPKIVRLKKETLRTLSTSQLDRAQGGHILLPGELAKSTYC